MIYSKFIEFDNLEIIQQKALEFLQPIEDLPPGISFVHKQKFIEACPEIIPEFEKYGLTIVSVALHSTVIDTKIHMDYKSELLNQCRINIPIVNFEGSKTQFFSGGNFDSTRQTNGLVFYSLTDYTSVTKEVEFELNKPTILRVQEPHRVVVNKNAPLPRVVLSIITDKDPVFML